MSAPAYLANFDSSAAMLRALSSYMNGQDFPVLDMVPGAMAPVMQHLGGALNRLPRKVREQIYIWSGRGEAIGPGKLGGVRAEALSRWAAGMYPSSGNFPAIAIGASNGALVHLCAALRVPWLPQTFLIPVARSGVHPDEPRQDMEWGRQWAPHLLEANPELQLHHMHDPNQDRLMVQRMTYFRVKRLTLGETYRRFIEERLAPGGEIWIVDCRLKWPTHRCGERHYFQFGALGGATVEEFHQGGERVRDYLARYGSYRDRWDPPEPDAERPEAEWGFEPALQDEVVALARRKGATVRQVVFDDPHALSPPVARLYRHWWRARKLPANRLLASSFVMTEPYWTMRTGSVPFWNVFNKEPSAAALERFLEAEEPFDEIRIMLFSHGVDSIGLAPVARWRAIAGRARRESGLLGVDEARYPRDFASFARYHYALRREVRARYPLPAPLPLARAVEHFEAAGNTDGVRLETL